MSKYNMLKCAERQICLTVIFEFSQAVFHSVTKENAYISKVKIILHITELAQNCKTGKKRIYCYT